MARAKVTAAQKEAAKMFRKWFGPKGKARVEAEVAQAWGRAPRRQPDVFYQQDRVAFYANIFDEAERNPAGFYCTEKVEVVYADGGCEARFLSRQSWMEIAGARGNERPKRLPPLHLTDWTFTR